MAPGLTDQVERLAHHALRGEVWDKALAYFRQAGDKAVARSAGREAVTCFEQALVALEHLPESRERHEQAIDVRFGLRNALAPRLEYGRVLTYLREAEGLAQALSDQRRLGWGAAYMADCFRATGDLPHAVEVGQRALALAGTLGDAALQVVMHLFLGRAYYALGDYPQAIDLLRQNVVALDGALLREHFDLLGLPSVTSRDVWARCLAELGVFTEVLARGEEGLRIAEAVNHPPSLINACHGIGYVYLRKGEWHQAISWLERGLEVCRVWDMPLLLYVSSSFLGYAYVLAGRVSEALTLLEQSVSTETMEVFRGRVHVWLGEAYLRLAASTRRWQSRCVAWRSAAGTRNRVSRPGPYGSSAKSTRTASPQRPNWPKPPTVRPWPWPRRWACARSRPTVTTASARCMSRSASASRPGPHCRRPSTSIEPWR